MSFEVKIIEHSKNPYNGIELITYHLIYPRLIHSEILTHRVFSRNAMSSRAIPVAKMIEQVRKHPAMPVFWGKNQPGMQASEEFKGKELSRARKLWLDAAKAAANYAEKMTELGMHKQLANRVLEPWQNMQTIVTATDWSNFYALRKHPDAQPEFRYLAEMMWETYCESTPTNRYYHLPYVTQHERETITVQKCMMFSTARCARVSYLTNEGKEPDHDKDIELYKRLVGSIPIHASPTEHAAIASQSDKYIKNFRGWRQHRVTVEDNLLTMEKR